MVLMRFYQLLLLTATDKTCHTTPACDTSEEAAVKEMCRQRKKTLNGNLSTSADMITHIQTTDVSYALHVQHIAAWLPKKASAVIFLCHSDKGCIDSGKNSCDKCDGENCDMYPSWQCRGV